MYVVKNPAFRSNVWIEAASELFQLLQTTLICHLFMLFICADLLSIYILFPTNILKTNCSNLSVC